MLVPTTALQAQGFQPLGPGCHGDTVPVRVDTVIDTLFAYVPVPRFQEAPEESSFRTAEVRAVLGVLELPLLGAVDRPAGGDSLPPVYAPELKSVTALVWFQVRNDGHLTGLHLEEASGWNALNLALQLAVLRADSQHVLRPLPGALRGQGIDLWLAVGRSRRADATNVAIGRVFVSIPHYRDEESPRVLSAGRLRYPEVARRSGIEAALMMEYIIDTTGQVEPESIVPVRPTYREFAEEAVRTIRSSRFAPARIGGCAVRARVQQPINFMLQH